MAAKIPCASESSEQISLFRWAALAQGKYPELYWMFHVPNGGSRNRIEAARLKAQGVKAGVSDIFLPVARGGYHGLWIEMKRRWGSETTSEQREWLAGMTEQGYRVSLCKGADEAQRLITKYLDGKEVRL